MRKQISIFSEIYIESFTIVLQVEATHKICQGASEAISRVTLQEAYPRNERFCSF